MTFLLEINVSCGEEREHQERSRAGIREEGEQASGRVSIRRVGEQVSGRRESGNQGDRRAGHQGGGKAGVREDREQPLGRREIGHQGGRTGIRRKINQETGKKGCHCLLGMELCVQRSGMPGLCPMTGRSLD